MVDNQNLFVHKNLFTSQNYKTVKGEKQKYKTYVLYKKSVKLKLTEKKRIVVPTNPTHVISIA